MAYVQPQLQIYLSEVIFLMMNFQIHQNTLGPKGMYMLYSNFTATNNSFE